MTTIDIKRVNIVEKDIEDWLWENPDAISQNFRYVEQFTWVARQYKLPSGILDLFGVIGHRWYEGGELFYQPILVEVKNQPLTSAAVAQVCRYAKDIEYILEQAAESVEGYMQEKEARILKLLIAPGPVDNNVMFEANAMEVMIHTFRVSLNLELNGRTQWTREAYNRHFSMIKESAAGDEFEVFRQIALKNKAEYESSYLGRETEEEIEQGSIEDKS